MLRFGGLILTRIGVQGGFGFQVRVSGSGAQTLHPNRCHPYSREQSEKVRLLEARVETLEQDNSALKDKASKLQEKAKAAAKEKKCILFLLLCPSSSFLLCSYFPCFDRA